MKQAAEAENSANPAEPEYVEAPKEDAEEKPFATREEDDDDEEDDGLGLDFIAQVQKEKTEKRASILSEQSPRQEEPKAPEEFMSNSDYWNIPANYSIDELLDEQDRSCKVEETKKSEEFVSNRYWKLKEEYSIDDLLADYN